MESDLTKQYSEVETVKYWNAAEQIKYESQKYYYQHLPKNPPINEESKIEISLDHELNLNAKSFENTPLKTEKCHPQTTKWDKWGNCGIKLFGVGLYVYDVVSDLLNGSSYICGEEVNIDLLKNPNNTEYRDEVCDNLVKYSHPVWGTLTVSLTWLPSLCLLFVLWSALHSKPTLKKNHFKLACLHVFVYLLWPFCGILL